MKNPKVYLDVTIGTKAGGRIVFELFADVTPKTVDNFRALCTGEYGVGPVSRKPLHYQGCKVFRVIPGFVFQCGDFISNNGNGGESIYGETFRDENFIRRHAQAGVLSMANNGRHTNSSQFFVTLKRTPQLDGKHVVFGQVCGGMEVVRAIEKIPVDSKDAPRAPIVIVSCGEVGVVNVNKSDPYLKYRNDVAALIDGSANLQKVNSADVAQLVLANTVKSTAAVKPVKQNFESSSDEDIDDTAASQLTGTAANSGLLYRNATDSSVTPEMAAKAKRLTELRMRINKNRQLNITEVVNEKKRLLDPMYEVKFAEAGMKNELRLGRSNEQQEGKIDTDAENKDSDNNDSDEDTDDTAKNARRKGKRYWRTDANALLNQTAEVAAIRARKDKKRKKGEQSFGWNVFNQDSLYRAHEKRIEADLKFSSVEYEKQKAEMGDYFYDPCAPLFLPSHEPPDEAKDRLASSIDKQIKNRTKFSRRRMFVDDEDVSYINERNRAFNKKLERAFGDHSLEIRKNLERGTAL